MKPNYTGIEFCRAYQIKFGLWQVFKHSYAAADKNGIDVNQILVEKIKPRQGLCQTWTFHLLE